MEDRLAADDSSSVAVDYLRQVGALPDDAIDLARTALMLATFDRPRVPLARYEAHLDRLAEDFGPVPDDAGLDARAAAVAEALFVRHRYTGDSQTYDDLQNANLMRVIDRRKGLPVALGILYLHVARARGWPAEGLAFPGHFLVRLHDAGGDSVVADPFNGGTLCEAPDLRALIKAVHGDQAELEADFFDPLGNRAILMRLQNNIKLRLLARQDLGGALAVIERMLWLEPENSALHIEAGKIHIHLDNLAAAAASLETAVSTASAEAERYRAATLLQQVRWRIN